MLALIFFAGAFFYGGEPMHIRAGGISQGKSVASVFCLYFKRGRTSGEIRLKAFWGSTVVGVNRGAK